MIIGTAGHIDHGKTALVRAITGVDTDRLKEEKERGISIDLGFAYLPVEDGIVLGFVDVPGHEKFVHNMLAGATGIDFVLLVVAADDGIMPQTSEHLAIVDLLGIARGVVALTKVDLVSPARRDEVAAEIAASLAGTGLAGAELVAVSSITGEGIAALRDKLVAAARGIGRRDVHGRFRLAVDRSFSLAGAGTVVTGTVLSGSVAVGDAVTLSPSGLAARVRAIHAQNRPAEHGDAGARCGLNLAGERISKNAIARGDMVLDPALHAPADRIDATLRVLATERKPLVQWMPARLHHAAANVAARIVLLDEAPIRPGEAGRIQLVLERPIAAAEGDRYVVRDTSGQRTIGGGRFLDLRAPARRRRTAERLAQLEARALSPPEAALEALIGRPPYLVNLTAFGRDRALAAGDLDIMIELLGIVRVPTADASYGLAPDVHARFKDALLAQLEAFHRDNPDLPGIGVERLRPKLEPRLPVAVFASLVQGLARARAIQLDAAWVSLPGHKARLTARHQALWGKIAPLLSGAERFRPPRVGEIATSLRVQESELRQLLKLLARMGEVSEVAADHFFLRATVAEVAEIAADLAAAAPDGEFAAAQFRDRLDNGRKAAIEILEYFDRHGLTSRRGDLRRMNRQRLDQFRGRTAAAEPPPRP